MIPANLNDAFLASFRALVRSVIPELRYLGLFDYSITSVNGEAPSVTIDCEPVNSELGLPSPSQVPIQPSVSGITATPSVGMKCVLAFLDADPTKPYIVGFPSLGALPLVRLGDQVKVFLPPTLPLQGTVSGSPFVGFATIANPLSGVVTQGSGKTKGG